VTDRRLAVAIGVLAVLGVGIAAYLTWVHYAGVKPLCLASGGCERVQTSSYAKLGGVPVAVIGLAGYLAILASLGVRSPAGRMATAFLAFVGAGFSAYLTYVELFTIGAVCLWCVLSAVVIAVLAVLAGLRAWREAAAQPVAG
jgi:uncharacterized membrane protein